MAGYLNQNGNSIGSLLRFIQEQKSQSPIIPQGAEVGSPLRNVVQEPLQGSEGIGTSKVVSLRPEGTLTEGGEAIKQGTPQSSRVGPISIGGGDVGSIAPPSVVAANEPGQGFTIPSATRTAGDVVNKTGAASGAKPSISTPTIGTTIKAAAPVLQANKTYSPTGQQIQNTKDIQDAEAARRNAENLLAIAATNARISALDQREQELMGNSPQNIQKVGEAFRQQSGQTGKPASQITPMPTPTPTQKKTYTRYEAPFTSISKAVAPTVQKVQQAVQTAAPKIGTILGGGALAGLKKLFGWK